MIFHEFHSPKAQGGSVWLAALGLSMRWRRVCRGRESLRDRLIAALFRACGLRVGLLDKQHRALVSHRVPVSAHRTEFAHRVPGKMRWRRYPLLPPGHVD